VAFSLKEYQKLYHKSDYYRKYQREYKQRTHKGICRICKKKKEIVYISHLRTKLGIITSWICIECYGDSKLNYSRSMAFSRSRGFKVR
jgi:hypothetical protein